VPPNRNEISESNEKGTGNGSQLIFRWQKESSPPHCCSIQIRWARARNLIVEGLHSLVVAEDQGSATVNDRIDGTSDFLPVEIYCINVDMSVALKMCGY
jgi:hypothetical protein